MVATRVEPWEPSDPANCDLEASIAMATVNYFIESGKGCCFDGYRDTVGGLQSCQPEK